MAGDDGTAPRKPRWAGDALCVFLLLALGLAIGLPRYPMGLDVGDEGFLAYGAIRVLDGQVPNRDFVSLQPPLSFYTTGLVFKLLGTSLVSLRIAGLCLYLVITLLVYGLARQFCGRALACAAAVPSTVLGLPFFHFVPLSMWQGAAANLAAGLLYLVATRHRARALLALPAGLLTAASLLLRQDQGVYLCLAILLYTGFSSRDDRESPPNEAAEPRAASRPNLPAWVAPPFLLWIAGLVAVLLPFVVYWTVAGALPAMLRQLIIFPVTTYAKTSSLPFPSITSGLTTGPRISFLLYYFAPVLDALVLIWVARRFWRKRFGRSEARIAFLLAWSVLFYGQVLARSDAHHLLITLPPFLALCGCAFRILLLWLGGLLDKLQAGRAAAPAARFSASALLRAAVVGIAGAAVLAFLMLVWPGLLSPLFPRADAIELDRAGVRVPGGPNLKKFVRLVQAQVPPDRPILALPYQPMFYFLCERRNPTRWNYIWPGDQTPAEHQELIEEARRDPPGAVLLTHEEQLQTFAPSIIDYVHAEYRLAARFGEYAIYLPAR